MNIPFYNLKSTHKPLKKEFLEATKRAISNNDYILGKSVSNFEKKFADYCETKHAIGVGSGLDALKISLKALNIEKNDEVIVPANTYIATWLAVSELGAIPKAVDAEINSMNIDIAKIENSITHKTKAIIPVHMYGQMCDMDAITALSKKHKIHIIEDFAQAHGAIYKNKKAGSWGHVNATSFYPGKNLGALGDAGAITTNSDIIAERVKMIRNYGSKEKYKHELKGINSRLDSIQAAYLEIKLKHLDTWNKERTNIVALYKKHLKEIEEIAFQEEIPQGKSAYHLFVLRAKNRDKLQLSLKEKGIGTLIHYPIPPHMQKAYIEFKNERFPITENIASNSISLPLYPGIKEKEIKYISKAIRLFYTKKS